MLCTSRARAAISIELQTQLIWNPPGPLDMKFVLYFIRTPKMYTTTGFGPRKNREMAGVDDLVVYMQTAVKYNTFYIQTAVFYSSSHIHHQIVHTSYFPIFSRPKPGGGVYLWGPNKGKSKLILKVNYRYDKHN